MWGLYLIQRCQQPSSRQPPVPNLERKTEDTKLRLWLKVFFVKLIHDHDFTTTLDKIKIVGLKYSYLLKHAVWVSGLPRLTISSIGSYSSWILMVILYWQAKSSEAVRGTSYVRCQTNIFQNQHIMFSSLFVSADLYFMSTSSIIHKIQWIIF